MKAVVDPSVFISWLLSNRGAGAWLMALWKEERFDLVASPALFEELIEVLKKPRIQSRVDPQRSLALLRRLRDDAVWVEGSEIISGLNDPEDDFLLSAAIESQADFIVTWERRLIEQNLCQGVRIIDPDQFTSLIVRKL
jgi:uncharacterized protein